MKFTIDRASDPWDEKKSKPCASAAPLVDGGDSWTVEINSIDELMALIAEVRSAVIVYGNKSITIYDDYVE